MEVVVSESRTMDFPRQHAPHKINGFLMVIFGSNPESKTIPSCLGPRWSLEFSVAEMVQRLVVRPIASIFRVAQQPNRNRKLEPSELFFPETENGTGTAGTVFQEPLYETQKNPFCRGTARTENQSRLNRSIPKP